VGRSSAACAPVGRSSAAWRAWLAFGLLSCPAAALAPSGGAWRAWTAQQAGDWRGTWCTHGLGGALLDTVAAGTALLVEGASAVQTHQVSVETTLSDCVRCFDCDGQGWFNGATMRTLPAGTFTPATMKHVICTDGSAFGPRVLRSGAMTLELGLRHGDRRVRAVCTWQPQSATAMAFGGNSAVPVALTLGRVTIAREALEASADESWGPPSTASGPWRSTTASLLGSEETLSPETGAAAACGADGRPPELSTLSAEGADSAPLILDAGCGISLSLPRRILPATPTMVSLQWEASAVAVRRAEATVEVLGGRVVESDASVVMAPPQLCSLAVSAWEA